MKKQEVTIIGGADGPTSVFLAGRISGKKPLKYRIRDSVYGYRRKKAEKRIRAGSHTLREVAEMAERNYHAAEVLKTDRRYTERYAGVKEGLILKYKPELLGDLAEEGAPNRFDEEAVKEMLRRIGLRSEKIASISESEMPMDFHIYEISMEDGRLEMAIDYRWELFGISYSGKKKKIKKLKKTALELYRYYGVSGEDIENRTERYLSLAEALSGR